MSAPKYKSSSYDAAADKYNQLASQYTGEKGLQNASTQASMAAKSASEAAGASATNQALNAGYSRAKAAMKGANASANTFNNQYANSYQNAAAMNNARLSAQQNLMSGSQHKDDQSYNANAAGFSAAMGLASGLANTAASAMLTSDETEKDFEKVATANGNESEGRASDASGTAADRMDDAGRRIIENMAKISALDFTYKKEVQEEKDGEDGIDGKEHIGVSAQELEENPVTKGAVSEDEDGNKVIDTKHLTAANTAVIGEFSRKIIELEEKVKELEEKDDERRA
jgi:hypothetical protein